MTTDSGSVNDEVDNNEGESEPVEPVNLPLPTTSITTTTTTTALTTACTTLTNGNQIHDTTKSVKLENNEPGNYLIFSFIYLALL